MERFEVRTPIRPQRMQGGADKQCPYAESCQKDVQHGSASPLPYSAAYSRYLTLRTQVGSKDQGRAGRHATKRGTPPGRSIPDKALSLHSSNLAREAGEER